MIATHDNSVISWIGFLSKTPIPVLKNTVRELDAVKNDENKLSARAIAAVALNDPLMMFRIISYAKSHQGKHQLQDLIQVEQAVMMMGTEAFYNNLLPAPLVEDQLKNNALALIHLLKLIKRAHRAAHFALDWAVIRKDLHADDIRTAALLHDLAEMMMWCFSPDKMNTISSMQQADSTLRSHAAQEQILGFKLADLQQALIDAFHLPPILSKLMEDNNNQDPRAKNVVLAVNLARHSANGWDNAALPDDYKDIANFLHVDVDRVMFLLGVPQKPPA